MHMHRYKYTYICTIPSQLSQIQLQLWSGLAPHKIRSRNPTPYLVVGISRVLPVQITLFKVRPCSIPLAQRLLGAAIFCTSACVCCALFPFGANHLCSAESGCVWGAGVSGAYLKQTESEVICMGCSTCIHIYIYIYIYIYIQIHIYP